MTGPVAAPRSSLHVPTQEPQTSATSPSAEQVPVCVDCRHRPAVMDDRCGACWVSASSRGALSGVPVARR